MALKSRYPKFGIGLAVCLLVSITICLLFSYKHVSSSGAGSSLCMPGWSIRCEPDECGSLYARCGRHQKTQQVPGNKVCYKGALVSANSGFLQHNCRERTSYSRNPHSIVKFNLKDCDCSNVCRGYYICVCLCKSGKKIQTTCTNNGQKYNNPEQAKCCLPTCKIAKQGDSEVSSSRFWLLWTEALDFGRVVIRSFFKQICNSLRNRFTFPPTMEAEACCTRSIGHDCNQC